MAVGTHETSGYAATPLSRVRGGPTDGCDQLRASCGPSAACWQRRVANRHASALAGATPLPGLAGLGGYLEAARARPSWRPASTRRPLPCRLRRISSPWRRWHRAASGAAQPLPERAALKGSAQSCCILRHARLTFLVFFGTPPCSPRPQKWDRSIFAVVILQISETSVRTK